MFYCISNILTKQVGVIIYLYDVASESVVKSCIINDNPLVDLICRLPGNTIRRRP